MKLQIVLLAASFHVASNAFAADIAGVSVGSTIAEASAAILKANPNLVITHVKSETGADIGVAALPAKVPGNSNGSYSIDQFAALQNENGMVWFVGRIQRIASSARVKPETVVASLKGQYGPTSSEDSYITLGLRWEYDRNGQQHIGNPRNGPCFDIGFAGSTIRGTSIFHPKGWISPTCGLIIVANIGIMRDMTVASVNVMIIDGKGMYEGLSSKEKEDSIARQKLMEQR